MYALPQKTLKYDNQMCIALKRNFAIIKIEHNEKFSEM
jgi:hypothetical protein